MKALFLLLLVTSFSFTFAQNIGDYRSKTTGNWSSSGSWEVYDGTGWVNTLSAPTSASTASPASSAVNVSTGSFSATATNSSYSLTLAPNATTVKAGDLLIVFWSDHEETANNISVTIPTGWTSIYNGAYHDSKHSAVAFYKVAVGGETSVTFVANNIDAEAVYVVYRINSGSYNGLPKGVYTEQGKTTDANPPNLDASDLVSGTKLWIATSHSHGLSENLTSAPSGFSNNYNITQGQTIRTASKLDAATSLDPGPFSNSSKDLGAGTVALSMVSKAKVTILNAHIITITANATANDVVVETGGTLTVNSTFNLDIASGKSLSVSGTIKLPGTSYIAGSGNFSLNTDATIEIGSADGISSGTSTGNIRISGTRTFGTLNSGAVNYVFNAASNQSIGNGMPIKAKSLTISGSGIKTFLNDNLDITLNLTINSSNSMVIPNLKEYSTGNLYFGSTIQLISYWAGTNALVPFSGSTSPFTYYKAPSNYKAYKSANFGSTTTGILLVGAAALPVALSNFTAKQTTDNNVSLAWVTSSESVNKGFSIERQEEGSGKFQSLGFIPSKAEGGNSQATLAYSFKDVTAKKGTNMYRLVQEDLDGKKTYSEVRVVKLNGQSVSMVFPNPSNGAVNISRTADGKKMNIQVIDQSGSIIRQVNNIADANYKFNIQKSGVYTIKMTYPETGEQSIQRIVVQK
jgi:hypothetical protein